MDKVVHFEIPADDLKRAEKFYEKTFGWSINSMPEMKYTIVRTAEVDEKFMPKEVGSINGGMFKRTDDLKNVVITIDVKNIDKSLKQEKDKQWAITSYVIAETNRIPKPGNYGNKITEVILFDKDNIPNDFAWWSKKEFEKFIKEYD